ncbi:MAG TPA: DNA-binding protein [Bacteroidales bacterium]|nr:MAG: DNA-binding protein [Bacteroidetes bacterium GWE2_42_24]OFY31362.1 MAG: DNA-binding protein [Bacteroidetes bacterium GWF2_43_11]PKP17026.1 MAG: DNA-binding protein [Bacteroidetes bacterium HGW-Bacteroidetes-22]HBZ67766.1 DNA-binding protein [Bacteroidales bacterium]
MNKSDLMKDVALATELTQNDAKDVINVMVGAMKKALAAGEPISLVGFGSFNVVTRSARKGRNPQTGKEISVPARKVVKFKPGADLRKGL